MDIVTKANIDETVYFMKRNKICEGVVQEINIKVHNTGTEEKLIVQYKMMLSNSRVIDTDFYTESKIFMTDENLVNDLLLKKRAENK